MASLIHELENNEALLLMYLTGELPPEDRIEVEQMLAADSSLRAELAGIESAYDQAMGVLSSLDRDRTALPAENHAIRQAMRAMKQWQVDRLSRQPVAVPAARMKIAVWMYPLASAAALLIGTIAWWGFGGLTQGDGISSPPPVLAPSPEEITASRLNTSLLNDARPSDPTNKLMDAQTEANSLMARSDGGSVASEIYLTDVTESNP
jgi:hypothetical protein